MKLEYSRRAYVDIIEAWTYYEGKQEGLGSRFLGALDEVLARIVTNPQHYSFIDPAHTRRDALIPAFPYLIVFECFEDAVLLLRVFNTYQDPLSL